jgi:uncharacterized repeat protein (TIGR03803 family)
MCCGLGADFHVPRESDWSECKHARRHRPGTGRQLLRDRAHRRRQPPRIRLQSHSGAVTILYSFCSLANCADGSDLVAGLAPCPDGNFYGVTAAGGAMSQPYGEDSPGTVFKITPSGQFTSLYSFAVNGSECYAPLGPLIFAKDGNFYGVNAFRGRNLFQGATPGTVFRISPSGSVRWPIAPTAIIPWRGCCKEMTGIRMGRPLEAATTTMVLSSSSLWAER